MHTRNCVACQGTGFCGRDENDDEIPCLECQGAGYFEIEDDEPMTREEHDDLYGSGVR